MNGSLKFAAPLALTLAVAACSGTGSPSLPNAGQPLAGNGGVPLWEATHAAHRACPGSRVNQMQCDALIQDGVRPDVAGLGPADFQAAYGLPSSSKGAGQIVAIVDAFDNPDVASDLAAYRSYFGLGTAKFKKFNQDGKQGPYPKGNPNWGVEIDLDVEMVSASCPKCTIYLIESKNNSGRSLYAAVQEAVKLGAHIVSNSWGGGGGTPSRNAFNTPGVAYLASSGDGGYGMQDPADYDTVIAVGGTLLSKTSSGYTERVWPDSGAGCSVVAKPSWQSDPNCTQRTGNDVAAVAMNAAEYDTYGSGSGGWFTVGGTSVSSPLIAGVFGLAGNADKQDGGKNFWRLSKAKLQKYLHYISSGNVVNCPSSLSGTYLCQAGTNQFGSYSGPVGWGTPNGIGAF